MLCIAHSHYSIACSSRSIRPWMYWEHSPASSAFEHKAASITRPCKRRHVTAQLIAVRARLIAMRARLVDVKAHLIDVRAHLIAIRAHLSASALVVTSNATSLGISHCTHSLQVLAAGDWTQEMGSGMCVQEKKREDASVYETAELIGPTAELLESTAKVIELTAECIEPTAQLMEPTAKVIEPTAELLDI